MRDNLLQNLLRNWPAYLFMLGMLCFFIYVIIKGNLPDKNSGDKKEQSKKTKGHSKGL